MSTASETLKQVAELLPPDQRERLLLIALKFKNIPEEDEFLQILEGIGLMTLVWSKIPQEIHYILEAVKPTHPNADFLNAQIRGTIQESIPSFEDLRQISQSLEQQQATLIRRFPSSSSLIPPPYVSRVPFFLWGMMFGIIVTIWIFILIKFLL